MSSLDWYVLIGTLVAMLCYGMYKSRNQHGAKTYLLADRQMSWPVVLLSVMATQASAITFLSAPGQAFTDGMRFVQYYFGLPIAMIVICVSFIPIFQRLKVYTAYEYLESRFDKRTRVLTAFLFLLSRALSTGISIYAPAIILSSILGWNIYLTNLLVGGLLIIYTFTGGAKAIAHTQKLQFLIILSAMAIAGVWVVLRLPDGVGFTDALYIAGKSGKLNVITTQFDLNDKYNIWSGLIGGFFLALSYFGTDNSQVSRYLTGKNIKESRLGLLLNGIVKIPMQFLILLIGALLFSFYTFYSAPIHFNEKAYHEVKEKIPETIIPIENRYQQLAAINSQYAIQAIASKDEGALIPLQQSQQTLKSMRDSVQYLITQNVNPLNTNDTNYIFLYFVTHSLPAGLVGLLFAVIFLASWGSISAALNSLAGSSLVDIHMRLKNKTPHHSSEGEEGIQEDKQELKLGRIHTLAWGIFCIAVAMFATRMGSLIEAVNVLGSLFYGTILGIFLVAFYAKSIRGKSLFPAIIFAEVCVIFIYWMDWISFLWLNLIGAASVVCFSYVAQALFGESKAQR